ncbi:MAG: 4Fe-4S dicluster domain-containing protein [Proteobacteria bacterium]|nr:4Fe-4S dicluster domain-containing protein [Pseudomonadota bacterium]
MKIAIASGKGGTGKTIVSTSLALTVGNATYVDMDVEEPNGAIFVKPEISKEIRFTVPIPEFYEDKCIFCRKCEQACVYNAISIIPQAKKILFFEELCHNCGVCKYVCPVEQAIIEKPKSIGTIRIGEKEQLKFIDGILDVGIASAVPLISGMKSYIPDDEVVIIDSPPGASCPVVEVVKDSDFVLMVTEPTPFGLNDLEIALGIVKEMDKPHAIIVNKHESNNSLARDFAKERGEKIVMEIPFDRKIAENYAKGIPLAGNEYSEMFLKLIKNIREGNI